MLLMLIWTWPDGERIGTLVYYLRYIVFLLAALSSPFLQCHICFGLLAVRPVEIERRLASVSHKAVVRSL